MTQSSTPTSANEDTVKAYLRAVEHGSEACRKLFAPELTSPSDVRATIGSDVFFAQMDAYRKSVPDLKLELGRYLLSDGDMVVCEAIETGTFTGDGGYLATLNVKPTGPVSAPAQEKPNGNSRKRSIATPDNGFRHILFTLFGAIVNDTNAEGVLGAGFSPIPA